MKLLFKLYLLGQLVAMPFMVGAIGDILNNGSSSNSDSQNIDVIAQSNDIIGRYAKLCDLFESKPLPGTAAYDYTQELQKVASQDVFGPDPAGECHDVPALTAP